MRRLIAKPDMTTHANYDTSGVSMAQLPVVAMPWMGMMTGILSS